MSQYRHPVFVCTNDVWYAAVSPNAAWWIVEEHLLGGRPLAALRHVAPRGDNRR